MSIDPVRAYQTETEVAVLQVQVKNIADKVYEIKDDLKDIRSTIDKHSANSEAMLIDMKKTTHEEYKTISAKISSLEKWRWMIMGAGVVIGSLGFSTIVKIFGG